MAADPLQGTHVHVRPTTPQVGDLPLQRADLGGRIRAAQGGGDALEGGVRQRLESGLGADLSGVRVHTDGEADALSRSVSAAAFTTGRDIFFRSGAYNPSSAGGMRLLAHEATHTVQQAAGPVAGTPTAQGVSISDPGDRFERAAEASAARIAPGLQRKEAGPVGPSRDSFERVDVRMPRTTYRPVVQRMVAIGEDLYYDDAAIKLPSTKAGKKGEWKANLERLTGMSATSITGAALLNLKKFPAQPQELRAAAIQKLENDSQIFNYTSDYDFVHLLDALRAGTKDDITKVLRPEDMLDEEDDLAVQYEQSKGCVLQALVNIGVKNPHLGESQQDDVASWHNYYYVQNRVHYDDDAATYQVYSGLGLKLIMNTPTPWKNIDKSLFVPGGKYVFAMPGHNFGVTFTQNKEYQPKDEPQRRVTVYQENLVIKYIWYKPN
ncbi:MAG: DUF4157 domain-containing protein [Chloroflexi bacterium]|nr:DUF4157 domain-containing protein [Chloroflexota bacterium]